MSQQKFYVTTPIYYVNDKPHIGHAYTSLAADVIARFHRLNGMEVKFLTGTDEHGQKVEKSAAKAGIDPQSFTDEVSKSFRKLSAEMNFSNDDFIRTTEKRHKDFVQKIWQQMQERDEIYLDTYAGWYSVRDEAFYDEKELVDGKAPTGADVEWLEEESYFFRLSKWQDSLLKFYEQNPGFIMPSSRRNEVISFVKSGLHDLSISRTSFSWGIKVPGDEKHVIYVWLDALFNYVSALEPDQKEFWPCDLHIVGKDILRFHAVYWPAFLMALDLPLPKRVFAHGWWTNEGQKISKSLGNIIDPIKLKEQYSLDYIRYYMLKEIPFGNDGNYSHESFVNRINAELANNIGNLVQRSVSLVHKNCASLVPEYDLLNTEDNTLLKKAYSVIDKMKSHVDQQALHLMLEEVVLLGHAANEYINEQAPWSLKNIDVKRMNTVLYTLLETIRIIGIVLQPIIPASASRILQIFWPEVTEDQSAAFAIIQDKILQPGQKIFPGEIIFQKLEQ